MCNQSIEQKIALLPAIGEPLQKRLLLAEIVSDLFYSKGYEVVIVGGSAIEFYTDGQYSSGDIDFCWKNKAPTLRERQEIMGSLHAVGGPRNWMAFETVLDLLGAVESEAKTSFQVLETPSKGRILLAKIEDLLVERILISVYPQQNHLAYACAKKLMAVCLTENFPVNWDEIQRLAFSPQYKVGEEYQKLKLEVEAEMKK